MFLNPNYCSNSLDRINLQKQVKSILLQKLFWPILLQKLFWPILLQKLFWPFTIQINLPTDFKTFFCKFLPVMCSLIFFLKYTAYHITIKCVVLFHINVCLWHTNVLYGLIITTVGWLEAPVIVDLDMLKTVMIIISLFK